MAALVRGVALRVAAVVKEREAARAQVNDLVKAANDDRAKLQHRLEQQAQERANDRALADDRFERQRRITFAACLALTAGTAAVVSGVAGYLTIGDRWALMIVSLALVSIFCVAYVSDRPVKWWWLAGAGLAAFLINVLSDVLPRVL